MTMPNIHPMAKMAKDASSGAVLIISITASVIGVMIFLPKILNII
jgi:diacylglycerol kinase